MKTTAVICECNPIHAGHAYLFGQARTDENCLLAVMSGSFTERGEAAVADKYTRAAALLACGVDAVVELPFPWSSCGAEDFARGGVAVAAGLGAEELVFGSVCADYATLARVAEIKDSPAYCEAIRAAERANRASGNAVLFENVMRQFGVTTPLCANDKLGSEYIRAGQKCGLIAFRPVRRIDGVPSATELRDAIEREGVWCDEIPTAALAVYDRTKPCLASRYRELLFGYARLGISPGEENDRLRYAAKTARVAKTADEFMRELPTKKYTAARMRRELLFSLLGVSAEEIRESPRFSILLAANKRGRAWLAERRKKAHLPLITKPADIASLDGDGIRQAETLRRADELYAYLTARPADWFVRQRPTTE